jgi:hypothetical protein
LCQSGALTPELYQNWYKSCTRTGTRAPVVPELVLESNYARISRDYAVERSATLFFWNSKICRTRIICSFHFLSPLNASNINSGTLNALFKKIYMSLLWTQGRYLIPWQPHKHLHEIFQKHLVLQVSLEVAPSATTLTITINLPRKDHPDGCVFLSLFLSLCLSQVLSTRWVWKMEMF